MENTQKVIRLLSYAPLVVNLALVYVSSVSAQTMDDVFNKSGEIQDNCCSEADSRILNVLSDVYVNVSGWFYGSSDNENNSPEANYEGDDLVELYVRYQTDWLPPEPNATGSDQTSGNGGSENISRLHNNAIGNFAEDANSPSQNPPDPNPAAPNQPTCVGYDFLMDYLTDFSGTDFYSIGIYSRDSIVGKKCNVERGLDNLPRAYKGYSLEFQHDDSGKGPISRDDLYLKLAKRTYYRKKWLEVLPLLELGFFRSFGDDRGVSVDLQFQFPYVVNCFRCENSAAKKESGAAKTVIEPVFYHSGLWELGNSSAVENTFGVELQMTHEFINNSNIRLNALVGYRETDDNDSTTPKNEESYIRLGLMYEFNTDTKKKSRRGGRYSSRRRTIN